MNVLSEEIKDQVVLNTIRLGSNKEKLKDALRKIQKILDNLPTEEMVGASVLFEQGKRFESLIYLLAVKELNEMAETVKDLNYLQNIIQGAEIKCRHNRRKQPFAKS